MTKQYDNYADLITFTRASGGTALRHVGYGTELVTNGNFSDGTTGWTDASTSPSIFTVSSAEGVLTVSSGQRARARNQVSGLTVGRAYQLKFDLGEVLEVNVGYTGDASVDYLSGSQPTGTKTLNFVALGTTLYMQFHKATVDGAYTFDNISVKEVIFDRATDPLVLFNHPTNTPRIEYDASGNRKGLLIEEARTNLTLTSENFAANYSLTRTGVSVSHGGVADPAGGTSASTFTYSGSNASEGIFDDLASGVGNTTYTFSIWLKSATLSQARLLLKNASSDSVKAQAVVNLSSEWQRFDVTGTTDGASAGARIEFTTNGVAGSMDIWGAQLEAGSFPTSYISTAGAAASRSADVASIPTSAFGYNADKGTVVVTGCSIDRVASVAGTGIAGLFDGFINSNNSSSLFYRASGATGFNNSVDGVVSADLSPTGSLSAGQNLNIAFVYAENDFASVANGGTVFTDTSGSLAERNFLILGSQQARLNGHIKSIQYYPRRLSNAQLQRLTA